MVSKTIRGIRGLFKGCEWYDSRGEWVRKEINPCECLYLIHDCVFLFHIRHQEYNQDHVQI
jgi:hypothetical protein